MGAASVRGRRSGQKTVAGRVRLRGWKTDGGYLKAPATASACQTASVGFGCDRGARRRQKRGSVIPGRVHIGNPLVDGRLR